MSEMNISFEPKFQYSEETTTQENFDTGESHKHDYEQELLEAITNPSSDLDFLALEFLAQEFEISEDENYLRMKRDMDDTLAA
ncbi:MAG: hypothetical protein LBH96_00195 [Candidatus Peribacteria bacterium]|jgi:hypothetical protein|nr:hypothetical protein [Candidatus Peribacteria bacterium]